MVLLSLAGLAIYIDPGDNLENFKIKYFDATNSTDNVVAVVDSLLDNVEYVNVSSTVADSQTTSIPETTNKVLTLTTTTSTVKSWGESETTSEFKTSSSYIQSSDVELSMK